MKRTTYLFCLLSCLFCLTFSSCEKAMSDVDEPTPGMKEGHPIMFRVLAKSSTQSPSSTETAFSHITLAVYQNGSIVDQVTQTTEDSNFGNITMKLADGNYKVIVLAHNCNGAVSLTSDLNKVTMPDNKVTDSFWCNQTFTVSGTTTNVNLSLERIVGKFVLNIQDNLPENVKTMQFYYTGGSSSLDAENGVGIVNSRQTVKIPVTSDMIGKPASFEVYTFPKTDSEYLKMKITALSASGATITEKTFEEVPIAKNQVTTYSGNFFGSTPGTGDQDVNFTITVNTLWDDQIDTGF